MLHSNIKTLFESIDWEDKVFLEQVRYHRELKETIIFSGDDEKVQLSYISFVMKPKSMIELPEQIDPLKLPNYYSYHPELCLTIANSNNAFDNHMYFLKLPGRGGERGSKFLFKGTSFNIIYDHDLWLAVHPEVEKLFIDKVLEIYSTLK